MGRCCEIDGTYMPDANGHGGSEQRVCSGRCRVEAYRRRKAIPDGMKALRRWVRADGKRPIQPDGKPASSTKPATWSAFEQVANTGEGDGWGIMLGDGLACYDLDHILDPQGRVKERHPGRLILDRLEREGCLFAEISSSGEGLHLFVHSDAQSWKREGVEFYSHSRFIRMTGIKWNPKRRRNAHQ